MSSRMISYFRSSIPFQRPNISYTMLGRWNREPLVKAMYIKIDQANEDNCGCCNQTYKDQIKEKQDYEDFDDNLLKYYCM